MNAQRVTPSYCALVAAALHVLPSAASAAKPSATQTAMDAAISRYASLCAELAADRTESLAAHVRTLQNALNAVAKGVSTDDGARKVFALAKESADVLRDQKSDLHSGDLVRVRKHFFALSKPLVRYVGWFSAGGKRWTTYYCAMAKASWLQPASDAELANPYYGFKMLRCGEKVRMRGE